MIIKEVSNTNCKWCGNNIENDRMFCCQEHEEKYRKFIIKRDKAQGIQALSLFGVMRSYGLLMLILYLLKINNYFIISIGYICVMVGIILLCLPYVKQETLEKMCVIEAIKTCQLISYIMILIGAILIITSFI